jgi:hypothetical protein
MASEAQIAANRANARRSTGPRTEEGKAASARNGLKHGLCAREAVLPWEDREGWEALLADLRERWRPVGPQEAALVEEYAGCSWRLRRALQMETGMLKACWPRKLQALADESGDDMLLDLKMDTVGLGLAFLKASKELSRLSLHESRIERRRERARKELEALQAARREAAAVELASESQVARQAPSPAPAGGEGTVAAGGVSPKPGRGDEGHAAAPALAAKSQPAQPLAGELASLSRPHPGPEAGAAAWEAWVAEEARRLDRLASDSKLAA